MARAKKAPTFKVGDYVRVNKTTTGVVTHVYDESPFASNPWFVNAGEVGVATVDQDGDTDYGGYKVNKLTKMPAPAYVVVWTDQYTDPFAQFSTKGDAETFAAKLRKRKDIVEVRVYRLAK